MGNYYCYFNEMQSIDSDMGKKFKPRDEDMIGYNEQNNSLYSTALVLPCNEKIEYLEKQISNPTESIHKIQGDEKSQTQEQKSETDEQKRQTEEQKSQTEEQKKQSEGEQNYIEQKLAQPQLHSNHSPDFQDKLIDQQTDEQNPSQYQVFTQILEQKETSQSQNQSPENIEQKNINKKVKTPISLSFIPNFYQIEQLSQILQLNQKQQKQNGLLKRSQTFCSVLSISTSYKISQNQGDSKIIQKLNEKIKLCQQKIEHLRQKKIKLQARLENDKLNHEQCEEIKQKIKKEVDNAQEIYVYRLKEYSRQWSGQFSFHQQKNQTIKYTHRHKQLSKDI